MSIYTQMHSKYGNPYYVTEFRLFLLNDCYKSCESCFYKRSGNSLSNYVEIKKFALELLEKGYQLETCYLLPTDFFENTSNYDLVKTKEVLEILSLFKYTGIASTLEGTLDFSILPELVEQAKIQQIELQINIINEKLFDEVYFSEVKENISQIRELMGERIVFNLAINLGRNLNQKELDRIQYFVSELSDDGILEINFTFLYNSMIKHQVKSKKLLESLKSMKNLGLMYNKEESQYNDRTLLRKPAFIFKDDMTYLAPMIPFDEYVFVDKEDFILAETNFEGFLNSLTKIETLNQPILDKCHSCELLDKCIGKCYMVTAREYDLPCFLDVS